MKILFHLLTIVALLSLAVVVGCKKNNSKNSLAKYYYPTDLDYTIRKVVDSKTASTGGSNPGAGASGSSQDTAVAPSANNPSGSAGATNSNTVSGATNQNTASGTGNNASTTRTYIPHYKSAFNPFLKTNEFITCLRDGLITKNVEDKNHEAIEASNQKTLAGCLKEKLGGEICGQSSLLQQGTLQSYGDDIQRSLHLVRALHKMTLHQQLVLHKQSLEEIPVEVAKEVIQEKIRKNNSDNGTPIPTIVLSPKSKEALEVLLKKYQALNAVKTALDEAQNSLINFDDLNKTKTALKKAIENYNTDNEKVVKALEKLREDFPDNPTLNSSNHAFLKKLTIADWEVEQGKNDASRLIQKYTVDSDLVAKLSGEYKTRMAELEKYLDQYLANRGNANVTVKAEAEEGKISVNQILASNPMALANNVIKATGWPFTPQMKVKLVDLTFEGNNITRDDFFNALLDKTKGDENNPKLAQAAKFIREQSPKIETLESLTTYFKTENQNSVQDVAAAIKDIDLKGNLGKVAPYAAYVTNTCNKIKQEMRKNTSSANKATLANLTKNCNLATLYEISLADPKYFDGLVDSVRDLLSIPPREFNDDQNEYDPVYFDVLPEALERAHQKITDTKNREKFIHSICSDETEDIVTEGGNLSGVSNDNRADPAKSAESMEARKNDVKAAEAE